MARRIDMEFFIPTYFGHRVNPYAPDPNELDIRDFAKSTSNLCRYAGHCAFYSVAEHSVRLSYFVPIKYARTALMHDTSESTFVDVPWPVKVGACMKGYRDSERDLQEIIFEKFGIPTEDEEFKNFDFAICPVELKHIHPFPENAAANPATRSKKSLVIQTAMEEFFCSKAKLRNWGWDPKFAEVEFLARVKELRIEDESGRDTDLGLFH